MKTTENNPLFNVLLEKFLNKSVLPTITKRNSVIIVKEVYYNFDDMSDLPSGLTLLEVCSDGTEKLINYKLER